MYAASPAAAPPAARLPAPARAIRPRSRLAAARPGPPAPRHPAPAPATRQRSRSSRRLLQRLAGQRSGLAGRGSRARPAGAALLVAQQRGFVSRRPGHLGVRLTDAARVLSERSGVLRRRSRRPDRRTHALLAPQRSGFAARRSPGTRAPLVITALVAPVVLLAAIGCDARLHLYIHGGRETLLPGRAYGDALVTQGIVASVPPGRGLPPGEPARRFVLRHPARFPDWNGTLVIAAHRGLGGIRRGEDGEDLGTGETELDDLVGWWALDQGFAWAGFDRAGLGAGPEGYRLTEAFARLMYDQVRPRLAKDPERTILLGYGAGGGLARYAAAAEEDTFDGALLVAATLGDPDAAARRREARLALAPDWAALPPDPPAPADPAAALPPSLAAYAEAVGMPPEGRRFWPFHDALAAAYPVPVLPAPPALLLRPVVEVVGALDDFVLPEVLSYRERTQQSGSAALHDLRLVPGGWRVDPQDDAAEEFRARARALGLPPSQEAALATGAPLAAPVRRALTDLDLRLRTPP